MKKVAVIGHFAFGKNYLDGQTVKTKVVTNELCKEYGKSEILQFDTHGGAKTLLKAPAYVWRAMKNTRNIIILPAHNGLRVFGRLLPIFKKFFKNRKIHYVVIGGWLSVMLEKQKGLAESLKKFDGIYVETNTMKRALAAQGFENVFVMPNCKELTPISASELVYQDKVPYRLCTFSRVMKEKGIEDAVNAVKNVNEVLGYTAYSLDIYGQIDLSQNEWFDELKNNFPSYITYGGQIPFDKSVETLKNCFALLFPTHYFTEGIPGTIIDAYAAGVPVISARWESFDDIVDDEETGLGYEFDNIADFEQKLIFAAKSPSVMNDMKICCLKRSEDYKPSNGLKVILNNLA